MVPDAREHTGVEHLEQQCRYAADHHCVEITMNEPGGRIRTEQHRVLCGKVQIDLARAKTDKRVDLLFDGSAYDVHAGEMRTVSDMSMSRHTGSNTKRVRFSVG